MGRCIEVRLSDEDRTRYGGPEWTTLDLDRLIDTEAATLERWENETGHYSIERALAECSQPFPPAKAVRVVVWLARKQHGANADAVDDNGMPESLARLSGLRTIQVRIRDAKLQEADAAPPAESA